MQGKKVKKSSTGSQASASDDVSVSSGRFKLIIIECGLN